MNRLGRTHLWYYTIYRMDVGKRHSFFCSFSKQIIRLKRTPVRDECTTVRINQGRMHKGKNNRRNKSLCPALERHAAKVPPGGQTAGENIFLDKRGRNNSVQFVWKTLVQRISEFFFILSLYLTIWKENRLLFWVLCLTMFEVNLALIPEFGRKICINFRTSIFSRKMRF